MVKVTIFSAVRHAVIYVVSNSTHRRVIVCFSPIKSRFYITTLCLLILYYDSTTLE